MLVTLTCIPFASFGIMRTLQPPSSYRESHLDPEKVASYERDLWDTRAAKGLEWMLERSLIEELLRSHPQPRRAIDFACGTGRVLSFLAERSREVIGVDISAAMLEVAAARCPSARLVLGDVTVNPALVTETADVVTAFRFLLNAEPPLRDASLDWMRDRLGPEGLLIVNFHRNPHSLRGSYLRLRRSPAVAMMSVSEARALLARHRLTVRQVCGYSYLPYRRDGTRLLFPGVRRVVEGWLSRIGWLAERGGCFLLLAERSPLAPSTAPGGEG
jgi:SAM-dependent methyltransferase